jgi:hypothetical protein
LVAVILPVGLDEDTVDLLELDGADLVAHRFDQRTQAQIVGAPQQAFRGTDDEGQGIRGLKVLWPRPARSS